MRESIMKAYGNSPRYVKSLLNYYGIRSQILMSQSSMTIMGPHGFLKQDADALLSSSQYIKFKKRVITFFNFIEH